MELLVCELEGEQVEVSPFQASSSASRSQWIGKSCQSMAHHSSQWLLYLPDRELSFCQKESWLHCTQVTGTFPCFVFYVCWVWCHHHNPMAQWKTTLLCTLEHIGNNHWWQPNVDISVSSIIVCPCHKFSIPICAHCSSPALHTQYHHVHVSSCQNIVPPIYQYQNWNYMIDTVLKDLIYHKGGGMHDWV